MFISGLEKGRSDEVHVRPRAGEERRLTYVADHAGERRLLAVPADAGPAARPDPLTTSAAVLRRVARGRAEVADGRGIPSFGGSAFGFAPAISTSPPRATAARSPAPHAEQEVDDARPALRHEGVPRHFGEGASCRSEGDDARRGRTSQASVKSLALSIAELTRLIKLDHPTISHALRADARTRALACKPSAPSSLA